LSKREGRGNNERQNMNKNDNRVTTRFGPEPRSEMTSAPPPFRVAQETELERLKNRLLAQRLAETTEPPLSAQLRRVANEAAALAWVTAFPLLMFPALFEEKTRTALQQAERQECIRQRSRELFAA
jgi:hypothetical protein